MSRPSIYRLTAIGAMLLLSMSVAPAQTPSPEAMSAARSLIMTLKLSEQYKALLPGILLGLKPTLTQDRPEIERDYEAMLPRIADAYKPYYDALVDGVARVYASNFSIENMRELEAFYRRPVGQKLLEKSQAVAEQTRQVTEEATRKATEELRASLTLMLREKGHKL